MNNNYIEINNLSKIFYKKTLSNKYDLPFSNKIKEFYALYDINLKINHDEFVVIYGKNGSGKSTLLKCICDIYKPSSGQIIKNASISPIIEIGSAFHDNLSGRENLLTLSLILGFTNTEIKQNFDSIVNFSGLNDYLDMPHLISLEEEDLEDISLSINRILNGLI